MSKIAFWLSRITFKRAIYPSLLIAIAIAIAITFALVISSLTHKLNTALTIETSDHEISFSMANYLTVARKLNIPVNVPAPATVQPDEAASSSATTTPADSTKK